MSWLTGIAEFFLMPNPDAAAERMGVTRPVQTIMYFAIYAVMSAIFVPPFWLAVWKRKNWARWFLLVGFLVFLPLVFVHPPSSLALEALEWAGFATETVAFVFIFTGDARTWYRREIPTPRDGREGGFRGGGKGQNRMTNMRPRELFGVGVRILAVWSWTQAAYTGFWGLLKSFGNSGSGSALTPHADFSLMIFYVLLGAFLMGGARALVWLAYGDAPNTASGADDGSDAPEPSN
jgi:hypothetical protein